MSIRIDSKLIVLKNKTFFVLFGFFFTLFFIFWSISGTIFYWEAWIYIFVFALYEIFLTRYLIRNAPELITQRLTLHENDPFQKIMIVFGGFNYVLMYILPAFDRRYNWSIMPVWLLIVGYGILGMAFVMTYKVMQINRWASRTIQVQKDQKVISTGLYGIVRHPYYLAGLLISLGTPLVLGSYWGLIGALSWLIMLILRLLNEEKMLLRDLPGYDDYCKKVKYHLIPGVF